MKKIKDILRELTYDPDWDIKDPPQDPLEHPADVDAREKWPWRKEITTFSSGTQDKRAKAALRSRRSYMRKREAQGKPYIPMVIRMQGRDAAAKQGFTDWASGQIGRPRLSPRELELIRIDREKQRGKYRTPEQLKMRAMLSKAIQHHHEKR